MKNDLAVIPLAEDTNDTLVESADLRHLLLKQVADAHCLLEVRFEEDGESFQSMIVELVPERGYLVLDALIPREGDERTAELPPVHVRTQLEGVEVRFASRITQRGVEGGEPFYKVPYPVTVDYPQRRREHRVTVPLGRAVEVVLEAGEGRTVAGEVRDLSPSGFSARITSGDVALLEAPDGEEALRTTCELRLPGDESFTTTIDVRHVLPARGRAAPRIGACFVVLEPRAERRIERYVAEFDREHTRLR